MHFPIPKQGRSSNQGFFHKQLHSEAGMYTYHERRPPCVRFIKILSTSRPRCPFYEIKLLVLTLSQ